jgi:ATP-dependent exoDNAse (exonuclease V) beta subunit
MKSLRLTEEQAQILTCPLDKGQSLIVEAGAGTGKTTCFIEYSKTYPDRKMLYLCFNTKSAAEAREKYQQAGVTNTTTSTIHGLAKSTKAMFEKAGKFRTKINPKDIEMSFKLSPALSYWVLDTITHFCYSCDKKIEKHHINPHFENNDTAQGMILKNSETVWKAMRDVENKFPLS